MTTTKTTHQPQINSLGEKIFSLVKNDGWTVTQVNIAFRKEGNIEIVSTTCDLRGSKGWPRWSEFGARDVGEARAVYRNLRSDGYEPKA